MFEGLVYRVTESSVCFEPEKNIRCCLPQSQTTGVREPKCGGGRGPPMMPHVSFNSAPCLLASDGLEALVLERGMGSPGSTSMVSLIWKMRLTLGNQGLLIPLNQNIEKWVTLPTGVMEKVSCCFTLRLRSGRTMFRTQGILPGTF